MTWSQAAELCEQVYGVQVDREERFFICPECMEPIYEEDWEGSFDFCPICEFEFDA